MDGGAAAADPRVPRQAAAARAPGRAHRRALLLRRDGRAGAVRGAPVLDPQAPGQGEGRPVLEAGRQGRREDAARSQHVEHRRIDEHGRVETEPGRAPRRVPAQGEQLGRVGAAHRRCRDRRGAVRHDRRRQVRPGRVDAGRQGLLLHVGAAGVRQGAGGGPARLRRAAPSPARARPEQRHDRVPGHRQRADLPARHGVGRRPLAGRQREPRLELDRSLPSRPQGQARRLEAARRWASMLCSGSRPGAAASTC